MRAWASWLQTGRMQALDPHRLQACFFFLFSRVVCAQDVQDIVRCRSRVDAKDFLPSGVPQHGHITPDRGPCQATSITDLSGAAHG
ncbi:hypothetical protein DFH07DRAFT_368595 [Mycena maculata]|uniref:Secreted protein n=1 Tax=Mycena maculata TaxID=230809 RepID=A0AAD7H962_9AGAR|nr:hypothetical protein DFH07DRAFT_368595 [Mycena maculata]